MIKKQTQIHIANPKNLLYKIMNDHGKSNQELLKELHELRFEHIALKTLCNKELSECMLAEKHFEESEEKYRFMFDDNPQPNWIFDMETLSFVQVNEAAINHYGYSREEFLSMTIKDIRKVEDIPSVLEEIDRTRNSFRNAGEWRHIKKNGELIFVEISMRSVLFQGKESCHVLIQDITDRKRSEEALKQANNELVRLHNNLDEAVFSLDVIQNKMLYASIAHQTVFGHSPEEFFKNPLLWYKIIVPEDKPLVDNVFPVLHSGKKHRQEFRIVDSNGEIRWIDAKMNPTLDENGILTRIDGIASDITDRKLSEEALKQANDELVRLHNNLDDAVFSE